jgi:hypothetical protein
MLILLQSRGELLRFDADGGIADRLEMSLAAPLVQIPAGTPHGFVVLAQDTAMLEVKPGPPEGKVLVYGTRPKFNQISRFILLPECRRYESYDGVEGPLCAVRAFPGNRMARHASALGIV